MYEYCDLLMKYNVKYLRAALFKPRTSPHDFQGLREAGIYILKKIKEKYPINPHRGTRGFICDFLFYSLSDLGNLSWLPCLIIEDVRIFFLTTPSLFFLFLYISC